MTTGRSIPPNQHPAQQLLVEAVNELTGVKGRPGQRAIRYSELVAAGLIQTSERGVIRSGQAIEDIKTKLIGVEGVADGFSRGFSGLLTRVDTIDGALRLQTEDITSLRTKLDLSDKLGELTRKRIAADSQVMHQLTSRVTANERSVEVLARDTTNLLATLTVGEGTLSFLNNEVVANAEANQLLEARVTATEDTIDAHSVFITDLQASVNLLPHVYLQATAPTGGSYIVGDMWLESDNGNKVHVWDGTQWGEAVDLIGATIYAQPAAPSTGGLRVGDLWFDTDDNNKQYRWSGTQWGLVTDPRIEASASAVQSLDSRVTITEDTLDSQASSITTLQSTVNHPTTGVVATANAVQSLDTRVDTVDGQITTLYAQHVLTLDVNNRITGWKFINNGTTGIFDIVADRVKITAPAGFKSIELADGIISSSTATHARYMGVEFGAPGTYIDWFGPKPGTGAPGATDANALFFLKNDGSAYFGGTLSTAKVEEKLGGNGVNLMPDPYSTFESTTLPAFTSPGGGTVSRDTTYYSIAAGVRLIGAVNTGFYFGGPMPLRLTAGKRYIVSFWMRSAQAGNGCEPFIEVQGGTYYYGSVVTVTVANQMQRVSVLLDMTANTVINGWFGVVKRNGSEDLTLDGIMVEEAVGTLNRPSAYTRGRADGVALSALIAAQNAQATADGQIDIYRQSAAPSIGGAGAKLGDYWQDSDDGKWWYCNGLSWIESTDSRLPQAIVDAASAQSAANTAQTTANARIRLFVQEATPTGGTYIVGDMWYQPSTTLTRYFNGSGWSLQADQTAAVVDACVLNPNFEQGSTDWALDAGYYVETSTNAAISGTGMVHQGSAAFQNARILNNKQNRVSPGQVVTVVGSVRNLGGGASGRAEIGVLWYANGAYFGEDNVSYYQARDPGDGTGWRTLTKRCVAPATATHFYATGVCWSHDAGYWCFDNIRAQITEAQPIVGGTSADNLVENWNFSQDTGNFGYALTGNYAIGKPVADGWHIGDIGGAFVDRGGGLNVGREVYDTSRSQLFIGDIGGTLTSPGGYSSFNVHGSKKVPVVPGEVYNVYGEARVDQGTARPANVSHSFFMGMYLFDKNDNVVVYQGLSGTNVLGAYTNNTNVTIPANVAYMRPLVGVNWFNGTGGNVAMPWATAHTRFHALKIRRVNSLDDPVIVNGTNYGKTANTDLYDDPGTGLRHVGVARKGSRKILGGARNSRANLVQGITSVRTTAALTADSAGQVTVNAHSIEIGGETVSYNAVTNAVVGLLQGVTYIIFTFDLYLDGGTRTYYAQTSSLSAQQAGEGAIMMGNITIPTSGSSGGGGGGGGIDPCVAVEMFMPGGQCAGDVQRRDLVQVWDECEPPGAIQLECQNNIITPNVECWRIESESGAAVVASYCTPMTRRDLCGVDYLPDMLDKEVLVQRNETFTWERVVKCEPVGMRTVAKISVHDSMYFAGEHPAATIATHNAQYKP